jgi:hypothetical protein
VKRGYEAARKNKNGEFVNRERKKKLRYEELGIESEFAEVER